MSDTTTAPTSTTSVETEEPRRSPEPKVMDPTLGALLKREYDKNQCREEITLKAGAKYKLGTVLGKITASGVCVPVKAAGSDGAENVAGVLLDDVDATSGDTQSVMLARGPAIVADTALIFGDDFDDAKRTKKIAQLETNGIVARIAA